MAEAEADLKTPLDSGESTATDGSGLVERPCPLCRASDFEKFLIADDTTFGFPGRFRIVRCRQCDMLFTNPQVTPDRIGAFFPREYSAHNVDRARRHSGNIRRGGDPWDALAPFGGGRLLDVGCGSGAFLLRQREMGWRVYGIEPSEAAADAARSLGLHDIWTSDVANAPMNGHRFDVITLMGVLDHIPDPLTALSSLRGVCDNGGRLIATVPNAMSAAAQMFGPDWPGWDLPRHQNHFSPDTLRAMLRKAGFDRVDMLWKRRTSHWRRGAEATVRRTGHPIWRIIAKSRNLCGLLARVHSRGARSDELIAVAYCD